MPISDLTQTPEGQGDPGRVEPGAGPTPAPEPPTIVRTSSSTARRMQASGAALTTPSIPLPLPETLSFIP